MQIAKVQNNQVLEINDYKLMFPNISFGINGITDDFLVENSCLKVNVFKPYDRATEKLSSCEPYIEDNWVYTIIVEPKTPEDIANDNQQLANNIRTQRNKLLLECDWTQLADSQVDKVLWATYRQALRDITTQAGFPNDIIYPVKPTTILKE